MSERVIPLSLKNFLLSGEPFTYFHLIRFEKPTINQNDPLSYIYLTDSSINITFNSGLGEGSRTYIANKVLNIGTINETIEAKSSNLTLTLAAEAIGPLVSDELIFNNGYSFTGTIDFTEEGFKEGDKISLGGVSGTIVKFTNSNKTITIQEQNFTDLEDGEYVLSLDSEEITALCRSSQLYYTNREVYIYRAYLDTDGVLVGGEPILVFKGIISAGSYSEDPEGTSRMTWTLTSHWGDFVRVQGRITSDSFHRALDASGIPDPESLVRPEYADDKGFAHSEKAVNIIAVYKEKETRYELKSSGLFGMSKKLKAYTVLVDRELDLKFDISAKFLPVVYGVRRIDSIPIFADIDNAKKNIVYMISAICEGEIAGIYDMYIDDNPLVCMDSMDAAARSPGVSTASVTCYGRADKGTIIGGDAGLTHGQSITITSPMTIKTKAYTGKANQEADTELIAKSEALGFKLQNEYYTETPKSGYWSTAHKLLDTAYAYFVFTLKEGETNIPDIDFVVKGRLIECYNYDGSYAPYDIENNADHSHFKLGDTVTLKSFDESQTFGNTTIIDKFVIDVEDGLQEVRWRYSNPELLSGKTTFKMVSGEYKRSFADWTVVPDRRVSLNPAIQLLDYITSERYGKGLKVVTAPKEGEDIKQLPDINLDSFKLAARTCDLGSNITITTTSAIPLGTVVQYKPDGTFKFQGKVVASTAKGGGGLYETILTDCIGKLGNKWNDWKNFQVGDLVWNDGYVKKIATAGVYSSFSAIAGDAVFSYPLVWDGGSATGNCSFTEGTCNGNPIVRSYGTSLFDRSGYSLYDADEVKYWRYLGWDSPDQRWVTRHQMNQMIRTEEPIFENVNNMLDQFNGILRYSNGQYELEIKGKTPSNLSIVHEFDENDIVGSITIRHEAGKDSFNSIVANIIDPQNRFDARAVTFFNSTYLKEDKRIPKRGDISLEGITNYYNARINTKQKLDESRYNRIVNFKVSPKGYIILAGSIIKISNTRFGWDKKQFRISSLNLENDGLVSIVANEHNDDIYDIPSLAPEIDYSQFNDPIIEFSAPSNLQATQNYVSTISLTWENSEDFNPAAQDIQIFASDTNDRSVAELIATTKGNTYTMFVDVNPAIEYKAKYFWIRTVGLVKSTTTLRDILLFSDFEPLSATEGVEGRALPILTGPDSININLTNPVVVIPTSYLGVADYTNSGTDIYVTQVNNFLTYDPDLASLGTFKIETTVSDYNNSSVDDIVVGSITGFNENSRIGARVANHSSFEGSSNRATIYYLVTIRTLQDEELTFDVTQEIHRYIEVPAWSIISKPAAYFFTSLRGDLTTDELAAFAGFSFEVKRGDIQYSYATSGVDTFSYGTISPTNLTYSVSETGVIIITGGNIATEALVKQGSLSVPIIDNNNSEIIGTQLLLVNKNVIGANWTVTATNENHTFAADTDGTVLPAVIAAFECTYQVHLNGQLYLYEANPSEIYNSTKNSYSYKVLTETNVDAEVEVDIDNEFFTITLNSLSDIFTNASINTGLVVVSIIDNYTGMVINNRTLSFTKSTTGVRGGSIFTIDIADSGYIGTVTATDVELWSTDPFTANAAAQRIAADIIAASEDGFIRPNDRVTLVDSDNGTGATRVYIGAATSTNTSVSASSFSTIVVEVIHGSAIVEGTLSASALVADTTLINRLYVGSELVVGDAQQLAGSIHNVTKTTLTDPDGGFFINHDGKLVIGDSTNFIAWTGEELIISGKLRQSSSYTIEDAFSDQNPSSDIPWSVITDDGGKPDDNATRNVHRGEYDSGTAYIVGDIVSWNGESWICTQNVTGVAPASESAYWNIMSARGPNGPGIVYRGTWEDGASYIASSIRRDVVLYNGTYYVCKLNTNTIVPTNTTYWESMGAQFDSVATDVLLAGDAGITRSIVVGSASVPDSGIIRSINKTGLAGSAGAGFYFQGDGKATLGSASNYISWDGVNLDIVGNIRAGVIEPGTVIGSTTVSALESDVNDAYNNSLVAIEGLQHVDNTQEAFENGFIGNSGGITIGNSAVIKSSNYVEGQSGFAIKGDGSGEFNTQLTVGNNSVNMFAGEDGTGVIQVSPIGGIDEQDYCSIFNGDIEFYHYIDGGHRLARTVKNLDAGVAESGSLVYINGYWKAQPKIIVSPAIIPSYLAGYVGNQYMQCRIIDLTEYSTGRWRFVPQANLITEPGNLHYAVSSTKSLFSVTKNASGDIYYQTVSVPNNTSEMTINFTISGKSSHITTSTLPFTSAAIQTATIRMRLYVILDGIDYMLILDQTASIFSINLNYVLSNLPPVNTLSFRLNWYVTSVSINYVSGSAGDLGETSILNEWKSVTYSTTGAATLLEGSLNWMAIGE